MWISQDAVTFGDPIYLSEIGLSKSVDKIDAAFVWQKNDHIYLFRSDSSRVMILNGSFKATFKLIPLPFPVPIFTGK